MAMAWTALPRLSRWQEQSRYGRVEGLSTGSVVVISLKLELH